MMSNTWSWYVIALAVVTVVGCVWLLMLNTKRRPGDPKPEDTSHVWDGDLTEYNKPLPRWWINLFYITIVFGVGYLVWYPGLGNLPGTSGWTSTGEHDDDKAVRDIQLEKTLGAYVDLPLDQLARDERAQELGRSIFANTCAACHGSSAKGAAGFPNLTDQFWNWGGQPEQILASILDGRQAVMPPQGEILQSMGGPETVSQVVAYVRTLRTSNAEEALTANPKAMDGKTHFEGLCVACHGPTGEGNPDLGAPNLASSHPMYGNTDESIIKTITEGRQSMMPAHRELLGETRSRLVAAYVWSLSNPSTQTQTTGLQ